jgi:hypothetical protein
MLSNCAQDYMKGFEWTEDPVPGTNEKELRARTLLHTYIALLRAFMDLEELFFDAKLEEDEFLNIGWHTLY